MSQPLRRLRPLIDLVARKCGYVPAALLDQVRVEGHVYVSAGGGPEVYLGQNILTEKMRVNAAGLLVRRAADWGFPVAYDADEGYIANADLVFPTHIAVGTGSAAATSQDTTMTSPLTSGGSVVYYQLQRILFHNVATGYPPNIPISASYYFHIPAGETYDVVGTDVDYQEWALFGPTHPGILPAPSDPPADNDMLARKVARLSKTSALDLTVRWEIRT